MNIKSLLLGSAAALVAATGARAADAIVIAEPEPMEYVRICDVYGAGFYYIPGTETCLRVGGYVRYDIGVGALGQRDVLDKNDIRGLADGTLTPAEVGFNDTYAKRARAAMMLDARTETEYGTLRGFIHVNVDVDTRTDLLTTDIGGVDYTWGFSTARAANTWLNHGYIELGGLRIGYTDSLFTTFTGYAGAVINDGIVGYGPFGTHQIAYTYSGGNGFTAAFGMETAGGTNNNLLTPASGLGGLAADIYSIDSYLPHLIAGVGFTQGWGGFRLVGGYDSVWEAWAAKARLDFNINQMFSAWIMAGWKSTDPITGPAGVTVDPNNFGRWGGEWAVWGGGTAKVSPKAAINVQLSYDDFETFGAVANVAYDLVPGFRITPEVSYIARPGDDDWAGFLRFQRNF